MTQPISPRIAPLSSEVVDQIAAGEVVERPSHLIKELIENAIDAGADRIEVDMDEGGRNLRVIDNGSGIAADQLPMALQRHATSKIQNADDLWRLESFGFRGEALASIAAVSRLSILSRTLDAATATQLTAEFGKLGAIEAMGGNFGTTIAVADLFANVPARRKFLKSDSAEQAAIRAVVRTLALAHPSREFRLKTGGVIEAVWPATGDVFLPRAKQVLEKSELFENQYELGTCRARVIFSSPHTVARNSRSIFIFVQGRMVQDRALQAAVLDAYRGLLMHGEYPMVCVMLDLAPDEVDVNIHPTKSQVKFRDPSAAFRVVHRALRAGLELAPWQAAGAVKMAAARQQGVVEAVHKMSVKELTRPYNERFAGAAFSKVVLKEKTDANDLLSVDSNSHAIAEAQTDLPKELNEKWSRLHILGQANLTYLIAQSENKLMLIDQHAAHERVAYERLMRAWLGGQVESQALLLPHLLELPAEHVEALITQSHELTRIGIELDRASPNSIAIRSLPTVISEAAATRVLEDFAAQRFERGGSFAIEKKIGDVCASLACHSVVRAGQALSLAQMRSLLTQMDEFPLSSFCPHGRPVAIEWTFAALEREFGRIS